MEILDNAYGKAYCQICNPILDGNVVNFGINEADKEKSRRIIRSLRTPLLILILLEETEITFHDEEKTKQKYRFTDEERLSFVLFGILYASRCNNFHGNVAARMNSCNANIDRLKIYTDLFWSSNHLLYSLLKDDDNVHRYIFDGVHYFGNPYE